MTRSGLHRMLDDLTDAQIDRVAELVDAVRRNDRLAIRLALANEDDPEEDEQRALDDLENDPDRGKTLSLEETATRLGVELRDLKDAYR